jgi:predicted phage terminase large subunit-like protein
VIQVSIRSRSSLLEDALSAAASQLTVQRSSRTTTPVLRLVGQPQPGPQQMFDETEADIAIYGGSAGGGKTWSLLREPIRHVHNPRFGAVIFRRTYPQIKKEGGMWDESLSMYGLIGATPKESDLEWKFPSGARVTFGHMQHEKDKETWKGAQVPLIGFDQLEDFTESQFFYMLSRNRSTSGVQPYVRGTCNPDADSWLANFIAWWIDPETGLPIPERAGVLRWFVRVDGVIIWGDSADELEETHPEQLAKSVTFIPAKLEDNRILEEIDPRYRANLMALPFVERERLLGGNWKIRALAGLVFDRSNFDIVDAIPAGITERVRYWDKAGTSESENPGAAFSAGVRMSYHRSTGIFYVEDVVRGQWSSLSRERQIRQTAELDGTAVVVWVEQEPGSGGKESAERTIMNLAGWVVYREPVTGDKLTRAGPYSAQVEARNVKLLRGEWNENFLAEHHSFPTGKLKDQVDASSGAFNKLVLGEYIDPEAFTASKR